MTSTTTAAAAMPERTVFFVSDGTGITAETFGNSILNQFPAKPRHVRRPFIDTEDKAHQVVDEINRVAAAEAIGELKMSFARFFCCGIRRRFAVLAIIAPSSQASVVARCTK